MRISLGLSNKNSGETLIKTVEYLEHKPKDKYDPHNVSALSCSTTLKIRLESENDFDNPKTIESYSMSYILDYIRKHGCIITDCKPINEGASKILKITVNRFQSDLSLRFCDSDQDIDLCIQLVHDYYREFHPKVTWKNNDYSISKMAEKGLKGIINQDGELEGKQWRALGYFEEQGLVAFVDSKNRVDGNLELGIALTRRGYRGQFLVSSLIWYHILDNYASPVFTGTYETNKPMKDILERCGFHDHYLVDGNKQSPRVKERFSVDEIPSSGGEPTNVNELSHYYMRVSEQSIVFDKLVKECSENGQKRRKIMEESNIVVLQDESGMDQRFEFLDLIQYKNQRYVVLLPEENDGDGTVVVLMLEKCEGEKEIYVSVESEEVLNAVYCIFKEKYKDEYDFEDE